MKIWIVLILSVAVFSMPPCSAMAGNTAGYLVNYEIKPLTDITIDKDPQPFVINTAVAGEDPTPVTDSSTSYSFSTNGDTKKIAASLDQEPPAYTTLTVKLAAPSGASSAGEVSLGTSPKDLITGIGRKKARNLGITYTFYADARSGVVQQTVLKVTFTVTDG
jgi:hypothetical protein